MSMTYRTKNIRLAALCETRSGYTARTRLDPARRGGVPAVQLRDLQGENDFNPKDAPHFELGLSFERYWAKPGDVLFRSRGDRNTAVVVASEADEAVVAILPLIVLRPDRAIVDGRYLAWFINQPPTQRYFDGCAQGQRLRMIPKACLDDLEVPVPDLAIQHRIVEVDRLARREGELLARLADKKMEFTSFALLDQVRKAQPHGNGAGQSVALGNSTPAGKSERTNR